MAHGNRLAACILVVGVAGFVWGCKKKDDQQSSNPPSGMGPMAQNADYSGPHGAGKKVFDSNGCARCHSGAGTPGMGGGMMGGPPGGGFGGGPPGDGKGGTPGGFGGKGGMMRGPDLAKVGANPEHTSDWLMEHIKNPKVHKPGSRMPPFEGKIKDEELRALAEYLASLKGE